MGLNDDWAVNVKATSGNGGRITAFDNVTYENYPEENKEVPAKDEN